MKIFSRIVLAVAALLVLALVALAVVVSVFVDPNDYRELIADTVKQETGRELAIEGELSLKLFPCCAIGIGRSTLGNPPGFEAGHFARVEDVRLGLQLWPLITRREVLIGEVRLDGLDLNLVRRKDGVANWEFSPGDASDGPGDVIADDGSEEDRGRLSIDSIAVNQARIAYTDVLEGLDYLVEDFSLQTGEISPGEAFDIEAGMRITDATDGSTGRLSLKSGARFDAASSVLALNDLALELEAAGAALSGAALKADLTAGSVQLNAAADLKAEIRKLTGTFGLAGDELPGGRIDTEIALEGLNWDAATEGGSITALVATTRAAAATLRIDAGGSFKEDGSGLAGSLRLEPVSPRELMKMADVEPPVTADPAALTLIEASGKWRLGKDSISITEWDSRLDDTRTTGEFGVANFDKPRLTFKLALDRIDVDRYLEPEAEDGKAAASEEDAEQADSELPREELRDLNVDGSLSVGDLVISGTRMTDLQATIRARDGIISLDPVSAKLYGGRYDGRIRVDATGPKTAVSMDQSLDAVQVGGLLADLAEVTELEGLVVARVQAAGSGTTDRELRESLTGDLSFDLADGLYKGMDLWYEIRRARAKIRGETPPERSGPAQTRITAMQLNGKLADGVFRSDRIAAEIPFIRLTGKGALDLATEGLDYTLEARVFKKPEFPDGDSLDDLTNLVIPLTIRGTVESPKPGVDLAGLAKSAAGQKLREKLIKELDLDEPEAPADGSAETEPKPDKPEDVLKRGLRDLLRKP